MKSLLVLGSLLSMGALTACPSLEQIQPQQATAIVGIGISVSPSHLNLTANSKVILTIQLEHPEQAHPAMTVRLMNVPNEIQATPIIIASQNNQGQLELRISQSFKTDPSQTITLQAVPEQSNTSTSGQTIVPSLAKDGSNIKALFSSATNTNANLEAFQAQIGYANFKGSLCQIMASDHKRNLLICLTAPVLTGKTYQLVDTKHFGAVGTARITYFEVPAVNKDLAANAEGGFWDSANGTLTLTQVSSQLIEFSAQGFMKVASDFQKNTATNGFDLEITGHVEDVSNL